MNWWNILLFGIIPVLSVVILFIVKKKFLWMAPLISTALSVVMCVIEFPSILSENEHRMMFFGLLIPAHLVIVIILTVIAYIVAHLLKHKQ